MASSALAGSTFAGFNLGYTPSSVPVVPPITPALGCEYRTASKVIEAALKRILVQGAGADFEPDEYADGIDSLNDFMASLETRGIVLGYTPVNDLTDLVTVERGAYRGIIANLAIDMAPEYGGKVTAPLLTQADSGMKDLYRLGVHIMPTAMPAGMPVGSGCNYYDSQHFYPQVTEAYMALSGNTCATSFIAATTKAQIKGHWKSPRSQGLQCDINGNVRNIRDEAVSLSVRVSARILTAEIVTGRLVLDQSNYTHTTTPFLTVAGIPQDLTLNAALTLAPGETFSLSLANLYTLTDVLVMDATVEVG